MRISMPILLAFGTAIVALTAAAPAQARRVSIDLGDSNFDFFGTQWDDPVKSDVRNNGCFGGAVCTAEALPFALNYGAGLKNAVYVYENGFVTFGQSINPATLGLGNLAAFAQDVIAPAYGDFVSSQPTPTRGYFDGEVSHTVGDADFAAPYNQSEIAFDSIFNITWNNVLAAADGPGSFRTYQFQIQLLDARAFDPAATLGDFDLSLNFGTPLPAGVLTGFKLGAYTVAINPASVTGQQSQDFVYSFRNGRLLGAAPSVPEPASWALMIGGFGMVGGTLRVRSARLTPSA